jgi:hypothetical protein
MKVNKYFILAAIILLVLVVGIQTGHAQPPPPPNEEPPCWPPPCIPVDNGILYATLAAVVFGAVTLFKSFRTRAAE